ncbi:hypothetical protein ACJX0J_033134, partial [Zea mays]
MVYNILDIAKKSLNNPHKIISGKSIYNFQILPLLVASSPSWDNILPPFFFICH